MKHYFHFKKGQSVPQWLLRVRDSDTKESLDICQFMVNGKVMLDDETGDTIIWPAKKWAKAVIYGDSQGCNIRLDAGGNRYQNYMFLYGVGKLSPLSLARKHGMDPYTTTKCLPLPDHFERFVGGSV